MLPWHLARMTPRAGGPARGDHGHGRRPRLDIAVEAGAKFVVVVNPLVPYVNDFSKTVNGLLGARARHVSDMGFPQIGYQAFKLLAYQRLHEMARQWKERTRAWRKILEQTTGSLLRQSSGE